MIKKILVLMSLFAFFICAQNMIFSEFDDNFPICSEDEKERLYDNLQHIYIKSIMDANDTLRYEVLNRLISGAKELGYDALTYEKELSKLPKQQSLLKADKTNTKPDKDLEQSSEDSIVYAAERANVTQTTKFEQKNESIVSSNASTKLLQIKKDNSSVVFVFDKKLDKKDIKFLSLKGDTTRYIYDIKGIKTSSVVDFKIEGIKDFRVSQFDKETVRIVFEHTEEMKITSGLRGMELIFIAKEFGSINSTDSSKKDNQTVSTANVSSNKTAPKIKISQKTVVIDAGHGGKDGGAVGDKKLEKDAVLQIALLLGVELKKRGHKVFYTRSKDVYLKLQERTKTANDKNADIFISIHANAAPKNSKNGTWQGIETFFLSPSDSARSKNAAELENRSDIEEMNLYSKQTFLNFLNREKIIASHKLAIDIQQYILTEVKKDYTKVVDGGVREAPFWVLTGAQMPAVLLEVGYITDKTDRERMFNKKFQQVLIRGIANGIESYFAKNM
ncbi:MAG: N-acetylmuramoyl-L-alanine amidase [Campylobacteraceae bacterium]|jgi:N-acetylmuramoyl-L-alanine amidase|nr:N-acetylmuramoyl-L-alanine amidase [Campylobacteraceae bacterium]